MRDKDLYKELLGISSPWMVRDVLMDTEAETITVVV